MSNIGLDFGTTYSVIAAPKNAGEGDYTPTAKLLLDEDYSPFYDTLAVRAPSGKMTYGRIARNSMKLKGARSYKGFKLLLAETDTCVLIERGYEDNLLPDDVVKGYISDMLSSYVARYGPIETLVIGVPEIWVANGQKQECYERLYNIVDSLGIAKNIILASEPTCACAYYISRYKEQFNGTDLTGNVLIVDYGGGTLDIALCRVDYPDGKPKVTVVKRSGAGANEEGVIGKAGFAFMEEIVRLALAAGGQPEDVISSEDNRGSLYECIYELETVFKSISASGSNSELSKNFQETFKHGSLKQKYKNRSHFTSIHFSYEEEFNGRRRTFTDEYEVDYGMVAHAFGEVILPVLNDRLDLIIAYMKEHEIDYGFDSDHFKIQLVGGFCNFFLVQEAVEKKLGRAAAGQDKRFIGQLPNADDRTMAVAYGASLLANEQTDFGFMSQYSFGLPAKRGNTDVISWAIKMDAELVIGRVYLFKANPVNADIFLADGITEFVYEGDYGQEHIKLDEQYSRMLKMDGDNQKGFIMGISQDRSRIISFHWWEVTQPNKILPRLGELEDLIASGNPVEGLGKEHRAELNKVLKLRGDGPVIISR